MSERMEYILFGRGTGLRVSTIALGGAMFGTAWGYGAERDVVTNMLHLYAEADGNFIDTADSYEQGESETIVGAFLQGRRDHFVLASKFTVGAEARGGPLTTGNSRLAMIRSVEASLRRLDTGWIDLYWVHMPASVTATDELVRGLDDLVRAGKIRYYGFSNFPAWRVARAATIAELRGWAPPVGIQVDYSLVQRTCDRELLPMARALGLGVVGWSPLGGGLLTGKYRRGEVGRATGFGKAFKREEDDARRSTILDVVEAIAAETGASAGQVAIAWLLRRQMVIAIGPRTVEQLVENLGSMRVSLSQEQRERLDAVSHTPLGFPHEFLDSESQRQSVSGGVFDRTSNPHGPVA